MSAPKKARKVGLTLKQAESEFLGFLERIKPKDVAPFLNWVQASFSNQKEEQKPKDVRDAMEMLTQIAHCLREKVHVDCFLFDEDDIEDLVEKDKLTRNYCLDCGSKNTKPLTFISHSLAPAQLEFAFTSLIPLKEQVEDFSVVDIGSRLGAVIYAASLLGKGRAKVTGIELNEDLCELQENIIKNYNLKNISVICSDVRKQADVISTADFVIMNNVFSFFMSLEDQVLCWEFLKQHLKKGCYILHNPVINEIVAHLTLSFSIDDWLEEYTIEDKCAAFAGDNEDLFDDCNNLHLYRVR